MKGELDRDEATAGEFAGARVTVTGTVEKVEYKADTIGIALENVMVQAGRMEGRLGCVMVYVDESVLSGSWKDDMEAGQDEKGEDEKGEDEKREDEKTAFFYGLAVGMEVQVRGKLTIIEAPRNPGEFDFRGYYRSKGIVCRMFGEQLFITGGEGIPYFDSLNRFRLWCSDILDQICMPEDSSVFKAVLLGDTSWLEPQVRSMYQRNGISHLLAVSGQHLTIIGGGLYLVFRRCGLGFKGAGVAAGMIVVSFGIMTGASGSAMRAVIMILCLWLAAGMGRSYDTLSALSLAALLLLYRQPYLLFQSGFQLSFGAVLSIGGLGSWFIREWKIEKGWQKTVIISICVQIVITPVVLYHYYLHPLYGIMLNLLVIPLISVLMYSGIAGIALGSVWINGGMAAVGPGHYILRFYEWLCGLVEKLPGSSIVMGRPQWWQIAVYGAGIAGTVYLGRDWMKKEGEGGRLRSQPIVAIVLAACTYGLCFLALLPLSVKGLEVVCLDVGQGDGIVLETREGVILVDGGSSSEKNLGGKTLEPFLKSRGVGVIDYSIVSHGDSDHISGLVYLMEESADVKIKHLVLPAPGKGQAVYENLEACAIKNGTRVSYMEAGEELELGELKLSCVYAGGAAASPEDRNAHSLVICADYGKFHMLFTGDMGREQEHRLMMEAEGDGKSEGKVLAVRLLQAEHLGHTTVLKTAHHGSETSSSREFLECLSPKLAVISYGRSNSYGHPSPLVLERFEELGIPVMETGTGGAVILKTDGDRLRREYFSGEE